MGRQILTATALAAICAFSSMPALGDAVTDFYKGNTIRFTVGAAPGGGYDLYSRTLAQHMAAKIPGKPRVITLPWWNWVSHEAAGDGAHLFMFTDREVMRRLHFLREEVAE